MSNESVIKVQLLGREFALRVAPNDRTRMLRIAASLDNRLRAFKQQFPEQSDFVAAVMIALEIAEEREQEQEAVAYDVREVDRALDRLDERLKFLMAAGVPRHPDGADE